MRKNKQNTTERKAALKRANKRSERFKKTRSQKHEKEMLAVEEKKKLQKKQNEEIEKILKSRPAEFGNFSFMDDYSLSFSKRVELAFRKKRLEEKMEVES
jgi:hypothetical protein